MTPPALREVTPWYQPEVWIQGLLGIGAVGDACGINTFKAEYVVR